MTAGWPSALVAFCLALSPASRTPLRDAFQPPEGHSRRLIQSNATEDAAVTAATCDNGNCFLPSSLELHNMTVRDARPFYPDFILPRLNSPILIRSQRRIEDLWLEATCPLEHPGVEAEEDAEAALLELEANATAPAENATEAPAAAEGAPEEPTAEQQAAADAAAEAEAQPPAAAEEEEEPQPVEEEILSLDQWKEQAHAILQAHAIQAAADGLGGSPGAPAAGAPDGAPAQPGPGGAPAQPLPFVRPSTPLKDRFNYLTSDVGAKVLATSEGMRGASAILDSDRDRYMMAEAEVKKKWVAVALIEVRVALLAAALATQCPPLSTAIATDQLCALCAITGHFIGHDRHRQL